MWSRAMTSVQGRVPMAQSLSMEAIVEGAFDSPSQVQFREPIECLPVQLQGEVGLVELVGLHEVDVAVVEAEEGFKLASQQQAPISQQSASNVQTLAKVDASYLSLSIHFKQQSRKESFIITMASVFALSVVWGKRLIYSCSWSVSPIFGLLIKVLKLRIVISPSEKTLPARLNMDIIKQLQTKVAPTIFTPRAVYDGRKNIFAARELPFGEDGYQEVCLCILAWVSLLNQFSSKCRYPTLSQQQLAPPAVLQKYTKSS